MRNSNKKVAPSLWLLLKIKKPDPNIKQIKAPTKRIDAIGSGIPFDEINLTVFEKSINLLGMADINIYDIATLAIKSKIMLVNLFFIIRFFILFFLSLDN